MIANGLYRVPHGRERELIRYRASSVFAVDGISYNPDSGDVFIRPMCDFIDDAFNYQAVACIRPSRAPSEQELAHWVRTGNMTDLWATT